MPSDTRTLAVSVECRASEDGPRIRGTIITEGRAASASRREVFTPSSVTWPATGIDVLLEHHGSPEVRAMPTRESNGEIQIDAPATPALFAAVEGGKNHMSVEFLALEERTTPSGIREVLRALVTGATVTDKPEYDTTRAEVRERKVPRVWL